MLVGRSAQRCQALCDDRTRASMWVFEYGQVIDYNVGSRTSLMGGAADINWYAASGWQDRAQALYDLAAEVDQKLGAK